MRQIAPLLHGWDEKRNGFNIEFVSHFHFSRWVFLIDAKGSQWAHRNTLITSPDFLFA